MKEYADLAQLVNRARPEILAMKAYMSARSLFQAQDAMIYLDANELPWPPYEGGDSMGRYPDQQPGALLEKLAEIYGVTAQNLLVTRGADEAIDILVRTFCCPGQDNIIITPPTFPMYRQAAIVQNAQVREAPLNARFSLDIEKIKAVADNNTKIVFICSPNNPTGNLMDQDAVTETIKLFSDRALVVVDEAYIEFADRPSMTSQLAQYPNLVVLRTMSKAYGAAGIHCGSAIAQPEIIAVLRKVLAPYPLPQPVLETALKILGEGKNLEKMRTDILKIRDAVIQEMRNLPVIEEIYPTDANFFMFRVKDGPALSARARTANIIVRDQSVQPALQNCIRIATGTRAEMDRLLAFLKDQKL